MSGPTRVVHTFEDLAKLIAFAQQVAPHRVPLYEAAYHCVISMAEVSRDGKVPCRQMDRVGLPQIVLVGDDDGLDTGPNGWACRPRLLSWARYAIVHATGGTVGSYRQAVFAAVYWRRLVLVETGTKNVMAWHEAFAKRNIPTLNLIPPNGGQHPLPVAKGDLH